VAKTVRSGSPVGQMVHSATTEESTPKRGYTFSSSHSKKAYRVTLAGYINALAATSPTRSASVVGSAGGRLSA
jgi:hypothetical protein